MGIYQLKSKKQKTHLMQRTKLAYQKTAATAYTNQPIKKNNSHMNSQHDRPKILLTHENTPDFPA